MNESSFSEWVTGEYDLMTDIDPICGVEIQDIKVQATAHPKLLSNNAGFVLDGIGALIDGDYMEPPVHGIQVKLRYGSDDLGYALAGFSETKWVGYSGITEVQNQYRRNGLGTELLKQKLRLLRGLGVHTVHSMVASEAGKGLVESQGFSFNEPLTHWGIDLYWTKSLV